MGVGICLVDLPHSLQWSPFVENLLAVGTSNRPGHSPISGILYYLEFLPENNIEIAHQIQLNVGVNQIAWSQRNKNILIACCDDYVLRMFDLKNVDCMCREFFYCGSNSNTKVPVRNIDWDRITTEYFLTAGTDDKVRIFNELQEDDMTPVKSLLYSPKSNVLDAHWNPHHPFSLICF